MAGLVLLCLLYGCPLCDCGCEALGWSGAVAAVAAAAAAVLQGWGVAAAAAAAQACVQCSA